MPSIIVMLIILVVLVFAITLLYILRLNKKLAALEEQCSNYAIAIDNQQLTELQQHQSFAEFQQEYQVLMLENEQVTKQLDVRTKHLQNKISSLEEALEKLKHEQPEDKLYRRAMKMVELGADIDEIIAECDLPRAEAQLLVDLHHKAQNS